MTSFPGSPHLMKGALVGIDIFNPLARVIAPPLIRPAARAKPAVSEG